MSADIEKNGNENALGESPANETPSPKKGTEKAEKPDKSSKKDRRPFLQELFDIFDAVIIAVVCAILILTLVVRTGYVDGESMETTMYENDRYLLSGFLYTPKVYDVVVFQPDSKYNPEGKLWVKRVIATEGQIVSISDSGKIVVDGVELDESAYLTQLTYPRNNSVVTYPLEVPPGHVFLLGDNRLVSQDSRVIGCVDIRRILGKVIFRFYSSNPSNGIGIIK